MGEAILVYGLMTIAAAALWVMANARDDRAALAAAMVLVIILAAASTLAVRWWGVPDIEAPIAAARGIAGEVAR